MPSESPHWAPKKRAGPLVLETCMTDSARPEGQGVMGLFWRPAALDFDGKAGGRV